MTLHDPSALALVFSGFLVGSAIICTLGSSIFIATIERYSANRRSWLLLLWSGAPVLLASFATALAFSSPFGPLFEAALDHCALQPESVTAACLLHSGHISLSPLAWLPPLLIGFVAVAHLARAAYRQHCAGTASRTLFLLSKAGPEKDVRIVESERPLAVAGVPPYGFIYVSELVWRSLDSAARAVLVAHERAHLRRQDGIRIWLAEMLAFAYPKGTRARIVNEIALACEQACDDVAARMSGRWLTAATILRVERLCADRPTTFAGRLAGFSNSHIRQRVLSLLNADHSNIAGSSWVVLFPVLGLTISCVMSVEAFHLTAEALLFLFVP